MNKELKIINELYYWKDKLRVPYFVLEIDNTTHYAAYVCRFRDNVNSVNLNMKYLLKQAPIAVLAVLIHEMGHVVDRMKNKDKFKTDLECELYAERFVIKNLKKYCSKKEYTEYLKIIKRILYNKKWQMRFPLHYKMFKKVYKI